MTRPTDISLKILKIAEQTSVKVVVHLTNTNKPPSCLTELARFKY
jgi:hypothetical protein